MDTLKDRIDYQSVERLEMLKRRKKRCVCKYCGSPLKLKRLVFFEDYANARIEIFCTECDRIEFGVEPEIYASAKFFVENSRFNLFPDLDENERTKRMSIAKVCDIMAWQNQNLGIMDENGFTVPIQVDAEFLGTCVTLTDEDLEEEMETLGIEI